MLASNWGLWMASPTLMIDFLKHFKNYETALSPTFIYRCICVLVFVFDVLHLGTLSLGSLYPGLSKNIAHAWSTVSYEFMAKISRLRGQGERNTYCKFYP